jgi:predicted ArsR family transcriptional regulator
LDRLAIDDFARYLIGNFAQEAQAVLGPEQVKEIVSLIGLGVGEEIEAIVARDLALASTAWDPAALAEVLVELKRRISGDFRVVSVAPDRIVLANGRCPFGAHVVGRPALCMMTSSVFGGIAARHFGYARVDIAEAIARGDAGCRVVLHLKPTNDRAPEWSTEYRGRDPG